jgi:predicted Na+-dependent transporter
LVALVLNFVAAPVFALVLSIVIPLERPHAIGLILLGGAAGAPFLPKLVEGAHGDLGFAVTLMTLLTVGTTLFMPFALPLMIPGLQASPWSIAQPLVAFILAPLAVGMLLQRRRAFAALQPIFVKLGSVSALVLLALLITLYFHNLLGVFGSGAIAACAVFIRSALWVIPLPAVLLEQLAAPLMRAVDAWLAWSGLAGPGRILRVKSAGF